MMAKTKKALLYVSAMALLVAFAGCSEKVGIASGSDPSESASGASSGGVVESDVTVSFAQSALQMTVGETTELKATVGERLGGLQYSLSYRSSETSVLTVDDDGMLTALKIGESTVTATLTYLAFEAEAECTVTVKGLTPVVDVETTYDVVYREGITLGDVAELDEGYSWKEGSETELSAGDGQKFTIVYTPSDAERYESVETEAIVNVEKATTELTFDGAVAPDGAFEIFYSEEPTDFSALNIFTFGSGKTVVYTLKDGDGRETDASEAVPVGVYTLVATIGETDNYKAAVASVTFTVKARPTDVFDGAMNGLPADVSALGEAEKAEIIAEYAKLTDEEKNASVSAWSMTRAEKYAEFFDAYVKGVDKGGADGYFTYFHTAYGPYQVSLGYTVTPAEGAAMSASFDSQTGFADEDGSLKVLASPDWTSGIHFRIALKDLSWQDASGADAVFCYVYNGTDDLLMLGTWPTLTPLSAHEWTLISYPKSMLNGTAGVPAADSFGSLSFEVYYYNETADRERLDNGVNLNFTSFVAAMPSYVNALIAQADKEAPDAGLLRKICDAYYLLSEQNKALVTGFAEIETLYRKSLFGSHTPGGDVVADFSCKEGMAQVKANIRGLAFSGFYPALTIAPDREPEETVTVWENRVGSLTSYYRFELTLLNSLIDDFGNYNVLTFDVYFSSPRNQVYAMKGDNKYYLEVGGKRYVFELDTWYTVRIELPEKVAGTVLTFYAWNVTQDRSACFMADKIYMTSVRAENFDFAGDFAKRVDALDSSSTRAEIDAVREAYNALPSSVKEEERAKTAWEALWNDYYVAPALSELNGKIDAVTDESAKAEVVAVIDWYGALEDALKNDAKIKVAYDAFYQTRYAIVFAEDFSAAVSALGADSADTELIAVLNMYRGADASVKTHERVAGAYETLCGLIEERLDQSAWLDVSSELAIAYNVQGEVYLPDANQSVTYTSVTGGYADDDGAVKAVVSANWTATSNYHFIPLAENTTGETIRIGFYIRSVDSYYRKIRIEKTVGINGSWKGYGTDYYYLEQQTWTFVTFELEAGEACYIFAQWWKDPNGNTKYLIGYEMQLEITNFRVLNADYVTSLIKEADSIADEAKKAEYVQKIKDAYGVLSDEEKAAVVGYDDFAAANP